MTPEPQLFLVRPHLGCDPEFFFSQGDKVIGAEKVVDANLNAARIVLDGVQVELNPRPSTCRETLAGEISNSFRALKNHLSKMKGVSANFTAVVEVDKMELDSLSDKAKVFGCSPSLNTYDATATITADPSVYLKRSAGGHIHLGLEHYPFLLKERQRLVPILDILLGNTCVLLDRNPLAAERRTQYGRAGEFRLPAHGLEYRTLSNFWLRSYQLTSFVMGQARNAASVLNSSGAFMYGTPNKWAADDALFSCVDIEDIRTAINTNDYDLALANFGKIEPFIAKHIHINQGVHANNLANFKRFLTVVKNQGLEAIFPTDPVDHWSSVAIEYHGWESYLAKY